MLGGARLVVLADPVRAVDLGGTPPLDGLGQLWEALVAAH